MIVSGTAQSVGCTIDGEHPHDIVDKIRDDVAKIGSDPEFRQKQMIDRAIEPIFNTPEEFARFLVEDRIVSGRVVSDAGLVPK